MPVAFSVMVNGREFLSRRADGYRNDLSGPDFGDGRHAFEVVVPLEQMLDAGDVVTTGIRLVATGALLEGSERRFDISKIDLDYGQLRVLPDTVLHRRLEAGLARARDMLVDQRGVLPPSSKIALFAINARIVTPSHHATLLELRRLGFAIIVINSDDRFGRQWLECASSLADVVVLKANEGRDFSSWLTAYHLFNDALGQAEFVLFVNESLCGPIRPLEPVLRLAQAADVGFWALSDCYDGQYHLQSSFFILQHDAISSRPFLEFVAAYSYPDDKRDVIRQGEIALSACLLSGGITNGVLCRYEELCAIWFADYQRYLDEVASLISFGDRSGAFSDERAPWFGGGYIEHWTRWINNLASSILAGDARNPQHVFWRLMIDRFGYPFIKKELLLVNPSGVPDLSTLSDVISPEHRAMVLDEMRALPGRAPPLLVSPFQAGRDHSSIPISGPGNQ